MKPAGKGLLIAVSLFLVLGGIAIVAIGWYVKRVGGDPTTIVLPLQTEGMIFGENVSESQCLSEAVARYRMDSGLHNAIDQAYFLEGCLSTSTLDVDFCTDVPPRTESAMTVEWRATRCAAAGLGDAPRCPNMLENVQVYCEGEVRRKKPRGEQAAVR